LPLIKEFEDNTKGVIRIRISKKNRQNNGQKKKYKRTNNDLQNIHIKLIPLKTGGELRRSGRVSSSCSTSGSRRVNLVTNPVTSREWGKDREVFTTSGTYPGHLWHRYSITVNQVMVATVKFSKWWLQLYQKEHLVQ
jgi:ribosomal protein L32